MYKNRAPGGRNNLCGEKVKAFRERLPEKPSQREFAEMLQRIKTPSNDWRAVPALSPILS